MKTIVFIIGALLSVSAAHAGEYSHYSRINFQSASTFVPSNKVCLGNGNIYHKTKATITVTDCDHGSSNCVTQTRRLEQLARCRRGPGQHDRRVGSTGGGGHDPCAGLEPQLGADLA